MKEYTKILKAEYKKDAVAISQHNNSKISKRTSEQNAQAHNDKVNFYLKKWNTFLKDSETITQKNICNNMIEQLNKLPKWY